LTWAAETNSVVVTADLDFPAILASAKDQGPSVLLIRSDNLNPENLKSAVLQTIQIAREELEAGAIVSIDPSRSRIRLLPLRP
jgi:predicted nuclease of predicted toxin-antitoxin system